MNGGASNMTRTMTGGEAVAEMLKAHGVGPMFGMGGFQLLPFYDAVRRLGLRHILINDERCGSFASDAYARVSNRPGVCDATLGPGATNLVTGLVESLNAGIPQVVIVGDAHRDHAWKNMTQETRQIDILRPASKEVIRVEAVKRIPELVRRAFAVATSGRPGPVVVDLPEDVSHSEHDFDADDFWIDPATVQFPARRFRPDRQDVERAARIIDEARRPLLLVGGGIHISQAYAALANLAEKQSIPVAHTMSGKGAIPCVHPLSAGLFGRYSRIANDLMQSSDALIVVGCKLGEIATKRYQLPPHGVPIIHIDIVPEEIGRTTRTDVALIGDARLALQDLGDALSDRASRERQDYGRETGRRMREWADGASGKLNSAARPINVGRLISAINAVLPEDGILVADGGFAAHWAGMFFDTKRAGRGFIPDRGLASIGYGLPGSLGAQLAAGDRRVVGLTGDGGLNMTLGELETAKRADAPFALCVINNAASGYVKALQHSVYGKGNYQSSDLVEMDYAGIAKAMGCHGVRVEDPSQLDKALREGLENRSSPTVIDVIVTRDPAEMLPGVDSRTLVVAMGDRPV
jgi:acetolactate synthase I/II/III large subunit